MKIRHVQGYHIKREEEGAASFFPCQILIPKLDGCPSKINPRRLFFLSRKNRKNYRIYLGVCLGIDNEAKG